MEKWLNKTLTVTKAILRILKVSRALIYCASTNFALFCKQFFAKKFMKMLICLIFAYILPKRNDEAIPMGSLCIFSPTM
jgi:hypothetical protein